MSQSRTTGRSRSRGALLGVLLAAAGCGSSSGGAASSGSGASGGSGSGSSSVPSSVGSTGSGSRTVADVAPFTGTDGALGPTYLVAVAAATHAINAQSGILGHHMAVSAAVGASTLASNFSADNLVTETSGPAYTAFSAAMNSQKGKVGQTGDFAT